MLNVYRYCVEWVEGILRNYIPCYIFCNMWGWNTFLSSDDGREITFHRKNMMLSLTPNYPYLPLSNALGPTLKRKCLHFDEIFITGCTGSCQNDNFQCSQWLKFRQIDDIFVSVETNGRQFPDDISRCNFCVKVAVFLLKFRSNLFSEGSNQHDDNSGSDDGLVPIQ